MPVLSVFATLSLSLPAILKPESRKVLTSLFPNARNLPLYVRVMAALLHLLINAYHYYAICLQTCTVFVFAHNISHSTHQLSACYGKSDRHFNRFGKHYKGLAVLQAGLAGRYCHWVSVIELLGVVIMILDIYQAVITGGPRAAVMALHR